MTPTVKLADHVSVFYIPLLAEVFRISGSGQDAVKAAKGYARQLNHGNYASVVLRGFETPARNKTNTASVAGTKTIKMDFRTRNDFHLGGSKGKRVQA